MAQAGWAHAYSSNRRPTSIPPCASVSSNLGWRRVGAGRLPQVVAAPSRQEAFVGERFLFLLLLQTQQPLLGPLEGEGLPPTDLRRVQVGTIAPDFRLADEKGVVHQLSQYRGTKNVVLVIYRGHW